MGIADLINGVMNIALQQKGIKGTGKLSLEDAAKMAPEGSGCYELFMDGELVYIGKAEIGLRRRFVQYWNGTTTTYKSGDDIHENKEKITVRWYEMDRSKCVRFEAEMIAKKDPPWNAQSGWSEDKW